jgi:hypothetical protein
MAARPVAPPRRLRLCREVAIGTLIVMVILAVALASILGLILLIETVQFVTHGSRQATIAAATGLEMARVVALYAALVRPDRTWKDLQDRAVFERLEASYARWKRERADDLYFERTW